MTGSAMPEPGAEVRVPTHAESDWLRHWVLSNQALTIEQRDALADLLDGAGIALRVASRRGDGIPPALRALAEAHARLLEVAQLETRQ